MLYAPGHDGCRLIEAKGGSVIDGTALFAENGVVANLRYRIECNADWTTRHAEVTGWIGDRPVDVGMARTGTGWSVHGAPVVADDHSTLVDVDLGFTPATNTNAIRRLNLDIGGKAETTALWLDVDTWSVKPLRQTYWRLSADRYEYASPDHDCRAILTVNGAGLVIDYPDLWTAEGAVD